MSHVSGTVVTLKEIDAETMHEPLGDPHLSLLGVQGLVLIGFRECLDKDPPPAFPYFLLLADRTIG